VRRELECAVHEKAAGGSLLTDRLLDDFVEMPPQRPKRRFILAGTEAAETGGDVLVERLHQDLVPKVA
jgi:hypothetical protein